MKRNRLSTVVLVMVVLSAIGGGVVLTLGCQKGAGRSAAQAKRHHCPMHPEIVKDGPGDCPICGMKLVPVEEETHAAAVAKTAAPEGGRRIAFYRSPMDPSETSPAPRKDSMGMDFVPVYEDEVSGQSGGPDGLAPITVDATKEQLLGLKTVEVKRQPFSTSIRTVGRVAYDERRVHHVHTRYEAYVEHIEADFTGKFVKKGDVLAQVYSPELYATQNEYLLALRASQSLSGSSAGTVARAGEDLLKAARQRLLLWDISQADITALEKRGEPARTMNIYAPVSGYVTGRTAYHGMKVMPADSLFDIVDLSAVWVLADVYEYELPRLALGQQATMTLSYWPGRSWKGRISYIYPSLDEKTRTIKVRLDFGNPDQALRPEMFAQVEIRGRSRDALVVPDDAVLDSGTRKIVFLAPGGGKLVPREIKVGDQAGGLDEVTEGLAEGDVVALGATFLVDSESRLKAALTAMSPAAKQGTKTVTRPEATPVATREAEPAPASHQH